MKTWLNFIGGAWVPPAAGAYRDNVNPADTREDRKSTRLNSSH